jgi:hypothetical protein
MGEYWGELQLQKNCIKSGPVPFQVLFNGPTRLYPLFSLLLRPSQQKHVHPKKIPNTTNDPIIVKVTRNVSYGKKLFKICLPKPTTRMSKQLECY